MLLVGPSHCTFQKQNLILCFIVLLVGPSHCTLQEQNSQIAVIVNPTPMHQLVILSMAWAAFFHPASHHQSTLFGF